ncbi:MAG: carboxypeptidase regulatory-like domain-containing protein, partial [Spirochaetales bacterium]|nr:carboxypeptidase regulatory-like domain-containing protein [Candidatus Physcosoma equi]
MHSRRSLVLFTVLMCLLSLFVFTTCDAEGKLPQDLFSTPTIKGKVSLPRGASVSPGDFFVQVIDAESEKAVYTGAVKEDGSFVVANLDSTRRYNVLLTTEQPDSATFSSKAVKNGYGGWLQDASAAVGAANDIGSIKAKPLGTITGKAERSGETEHYDTTVYIPGTSYIAMTEKDGSFSIFNVPQGTYRLRFISDGYLSKMKENVVLHSDDDETSPTASVGKVSLVRNEGTVTGCVLLPGALDNAGVNVKLEDKDGNGTEASTSADGTFSVKVVPGTYTAVISYPGYLTETITGISVTAANTTSLKDKVTLVANGAVITGSIRLSEGSGSEGTIVLARSSDNRYRYTTTAGTDGKYTFDTVFPGTYTLTYTRTSYTTVTREGVAVTSGSTTPVSSVTISSIYGRVTGSVTTNDGKDAAGAVVLLSGSQDYNAVVGTDGTWEMTGVIPGTYLIEVSKADYAVGKGSVSVIADKTVSATSVSLKSSFGSLKGSVTDTRGNALPHANIKIGEAIGATADDNGSFLKNDVPVGSYTVTV